MAQFTNQAHLSYLDNVTVSNVAVGEILEAITITKTPVLMPDGSETNQFWNGHNIIKRSKPTAYSF